jgi:hypothetical protein
MEEEQSPAPDSPPLAALADDLVWIVDSDAQVLRRPRALADAAIEAGKARLANAQDLAVAGVSL